MPHIHRSQLTLLLLAASALAGGCERVPTQSPTTPVALHPGDARALGAAEGRKLGKDSILIIEEKDFAKYGITLPTVGTLKAKKPKDKEGEMFSTACRPDQAYCDPVCPLGSGEPATADDCNDPCTIDPSVGLGAGSERFADVAILIRPDPWFGNDHDA